MDQGNIPVATPVSTGPAGQGSNAGGKAIAALVLGIASLVCAGFLTGIPAIILGYMEMKAIKAGDAPKAGEPFAKIGYILGIIGTVLSCLFLLVSVVLAVLGVSLGTFEAFRNTTTV